MSKTSIVCVTPSIRPESMAEFRKAWAPLFERHGVTLITVWDGEVPDLEAPGDLGTVKRNLFTEDSEIRTLLCRKTDAIRNWGFIEAARRGFDYIFTADDDVHPPAGSDPIQEHLDVLQRRVPISWMNTALPGGLNSIPRTREEIDNVPTYLRGFPYGIRDEAPVKVSHGVWVNVPDFDGRTQLELGKCLYCGGSGSVDSGGTRPDGEPVNLSCPDCKGTGYDGSRLPYSLPYFRGPVPKGTYLPFCGMNVMVHRDALPYLYFAPMGPDSGVEGLNRFADIWCGILLKRQMDSLGWAMYTGASTVIHTRASDPFKNVEQEKLGIEWNEYAWGLPRVIDGIASDGFLNYWKSYLDKADRFRKLIQGLQSK